MEDNKTLTTNDPQFNYRIEEQLKECENCGVFSNNVKREYFTEMNLCPLCQPEDL